MRAGVARVDVFRKGEDTAVLRALAWKEYRQQRAVLFAGLGLAVATPLVVLAIHVAGERDTFSNLDEVVLVLPAAFLAVVWPLLAAAAGSTTIATEREEQTLRFLLSRPVSRNRLWLAKVGMASAVLLVTAAVSSLILWAVNGAAPPEHTAPGFAALMQSTRVVGFSPLVVASMNVLLFACAVLCSSLLTRALTAAAAALALAMTVTATILMVWTRLSLSPRFEPLWLASEVLLVSGALLLASWLVFAHGDFFHGNPGVPRSRWVGALLVAALTVASVAGLVLPLAYAAADQTAADVALDPEAVAMNDQYLATTGTSKGGGLTRAWLMNEDGIGLRPLAGRHTLTPLFVTGSDWVLYKSRRRFGRETGTVDLRLVHAGHGEDRLVLADVPAQAKLFFGGDAGNLLRPDDRVAFVDGGRLTVARVDGRGHATYDVAATDLDRALVLGFNDNEIEEIVYLRAADGSMPRERGDGAATIAVYRPSTGETRVLRELADGWVLPRLSWAENAPAQWSPTSGWAHVPVISGNVLELVDAVDGEVARLHELAVADAGDRGAAERCRVIQMAGRGDWRNEDGDLVRRDQFLLGDCSAAARAEAAGILASRRATAMASTDGNAPVAEREDPAGVLRLVVAGTRDELVWPLPPFEGEIRLVWLRPVPPREVLLDILSDDRGGSYAMVVGIDGTTRRYPDGWRARGWWRSTGVRLQGESEGGVAFAVGDEKGRVRPLYPLPGPGQ